MKRAINRDFQSLRLRRPNPEMHSPISAQLRADRIAALNFCLTHPTASLGAGAAVLHKLNIPRRTVRTVIPFFFHMPATTEKVRVIDHPLVAAGLSVLRARQTTPDIF